MLQTIVITRQRVRKPGVRRRSRTQTRAGTQHATLAPTVGLLAPIRAARKTAMVKSAHWQKPASDKGSAAQEQRQLKPGKSDLQAPRDMDWHKLAKDKLGVGFSGNAV